MEKKRNSTLELLKVIAIFLIVWSHMTPNRSTIESITGLTSLSIGSLNFFNQVFLTQKSLGHIGNVLFATASAWFLLDSKNVKIKKIISLIFQTFIISVLFLIVMIPFKETLGITYDLKLILKYVFPLIHGNNWYIGSYLVLYAIHPLLNYLIDKLSKKNLLIICIIGLIIYSVWMMIDYVWVIGFIIIYFFTAWVKKYGLFFGFDINNKKNVILMIVIGIIGYFIFLFSTSHYAVLNPNVFYNDKLGLITDMFNPFILLIGTGLFYLFLKLKPFNNNIINIISELSLSVYLIHLNGLLSEYVYPLIFTSIINYSDIIIFLICFGYAVLVFIISLILAFGINKLILKPCNKLLDKIIEEKNNYIPRKEIIEESI